MILVYALVHNDLLGVFSTIKKATAEFDRLANKNPGIYNHETMWVYEVAVDGTLRDVTNEE